MKKITPTSSSSSSFIDLFDTAVTSSAKPPLSSASSASKVHERKAPLTSTPKRQGAISYSAKCDAFSSESDESGSPSPTRNKNSKGLRSKAKAANKAKKTPPEKAAAGKPKAKASSDTLAVTGACVPANGSILLTSKSAEIKGFVRVHNTSDTNVWMLPQYDYMPPNGPLLQGDSKPNHVPVAWGQSALRVEIVVLNLDLCEGGKRALPASTLARLTAPGVSFSMEEIIASIPPIPGSEDSQCDMKNYLGFRRSAWEVLVARELVGRISVGTHADFLVHVATGEIYQTYLCKEDEYALVIQEALANSKAAWASGAFVLSRPRQLASSSSMLAASSISTSDALNTFLNVIGTSGCVSLLQKIIRRRPKQLSHPDRNEQYPGEFVLRALVKRLLHPCQPGIFLPDLGLYITARTHLLKRLMVIMAEDSEYQPSTARMLASAALVARGFPDWSPDDLLCAQLEDTAVALYLAQRTSSYDVNAGCALAASKFGPSCDLANEFPSLALDELGGMDGDKGMLRWLRSRPRNTIISNEPVSGTDCLDIFCDQHIDGRLVYLWRPAPASSPTPGCPYAAELNRAFENVSGLNTRRTPRPSRHSPFAAQVLFAMTECSRFLRGVSSPAPAPTEAARYKCVLPHGSLAGMIGPLQVKVDSKALLVTLDPHALPEVRLVVIPKPSRTSDLSELDNHDRKAAQALARAKLADGCVLHNAPHPALDGKRVVLDGDAWIIEGQPWNQVRQVEFPLVCPVQWPVKTFFNPSEPLPWQPGFRIEDFETTAERDSTMSYSRGAVQWVCARLAGFEPLIPMPRVARGGGGVTEPLTGTEGEAYRLLRALALNYPDALWPSPSVPFAFESRCVPMRLEIRERLLAVVRQFENKQGEDCNMASFPIWRDTRELRSLQTQALAELEHADRQQLGHFLWMLVGSGKTLTVLKFLDKTRRVRNILWCLPQSAMRSVAKEVRRVGWCVRVLASSKGRLSCANEWTSTAERTLETRLAPYTVTLVEHDDLRNLASHLAAQMPDTAFVYDEVHKAMAALTQRTAVALRLARLSGQLIALTGTPMVSSKAHPLMQWLRLCVPFPVSTRNFWVAANAMIAKLATTEVQIRESVQEVEPSAAQAQELALLLPPRLGGTAAHPDYRKALQLSTSIVDRWLVTETRRLVYAVRGPAPEGAPPRAEFNSEHEYAVACTRALAPSLELTNHLEQRVVLVASTKTHAARLVDDLLALGTPPQHILMIGGKQRPTDLTVSVRHVSTVCLTEQDVQEAEEMPEGKKAAAEDSITRRPPLICVVPLEYCEGYSLTWMTIMLSGVYPSNQAKRTQMEGRINRACCQRIHREYVVAMTGLSTLMYKYHRNAKNLEKALAEIGRSGPRSLISGIDAAPGGAVAVEESDAESEKVVKKTAKKRKAPVENKENWSTKKLKAISE